METSKLEDTPFHNQESELDRISCGWAVPSSAEVGDSIVYMCLATKTG